MKKNKIIFMGLFILLIVSACSQSTEKAIIGTWKDVDEDNDCIEVEGKKISFDDDGMVVGIPDYKNFKIQEGKSGEFDYIVLSGDFNNTMRYKVTFDSEDNLLFVDEDDEDGMDSSVACHMEKVNE